MATTTAAATEHATEQGTVYPHWIAGRAHTGAGERRGIVYQPASGMAQGQVAFAGPADVDAAVSAAQQAFAAWGRSSLAERSQVMFALREQLERQRDRLARVIVAEHGKVLADATGEVKRGSEVVEFACGIPSLLKGEYSQRVAAGLDMVTVRQPLGVVCGITPFNFPVMVPLWMAPIAIACGNAFVLKPSERDPGAALVLAELFGEAGLPPGVFSVVHGDQQTVELLLDHPGIAAVSFVGSTAVARSIYQRAARSGKRVQALGGAKNHMLVLPDADLDAAADAAVSAGYGSAGERCMAISVVVAVGEIADELVRRIRERAAALTVGPGLGAACDMGPLITREHRDRVARSVAAGQRDGASLVLDGSANPAAQGEGFFLGPSLFDHVTPEMSIYRDEIFGPVLSVVRAESYRSALEVVRRCPYGNGVALFTRDGGAARRFEDDAPAGMVGFNVAIPVPAAYHSFGGWGQSLFGDCHVHGPEGVRFYTRAKTITSRWHESPRGPDLSFPRLG